MGRNHSSHLAWMVLLCIVPGLLIAAGAWAFGWKLNSTLTTSMVIGAMVLCHFMMLRGHGHGKDGCKKQKES